MIREASTIDEVALEDAETGDQQITNIEEYEADTEAMMTELSERLQSDPALQEALDQAEREQSHETWENFIRLLEARQNQELAKLAEESTATHPTTQAAPPLPEKLRRNVQRPQQHQ